MLKTISNVECEKNSSQEQYSTNGGFKQRLSALPAEILELPRFLPTRADNPKQPLCKGWQDPKNQKLFSELKGAGSIGFVAATDSDDSLLFADFDHALDENGNFVNADAESWFYTFSKDGFYCEKSQSGRGLHFFAEPTRGKYEKVTGRIYLTDDKKSYIEIFYRSNRNCFVTGNVFCCKPNAPIAKGEEADRMMDEIIKSLKKQKKSTKKDIATLGNDYDLWRAERMLDIINPADLSDSDWLAVMTACKNLGVSDSIVDAFNRRDPDRYNEAENQSRCDSVKGSSFGIETLLGIAKRFGYSEKDSQREWYNLHSVHVSKSDTQTFDEIKKRIWERCHWSHDKYGNPTTIKGNSFENHKLIFDNDPNLKNLFGRDNFRQETVFFRRAPWHSANTPLKDSWDDTDDAELRLYLREHYAEMYHPQTTFDFLIRVAREHSFHAVKRFLDGLPKWDNVPRAENIFVKFLGAKDSEYTRAVTKHFLFGAIARALYPGCDFQEVPVLQGAQGIGKSRLVRMLGGKHGVNPKGENWHIALRDQLDDSHAVDAMRKGWIVEIEEFAAGSRADVNAMKGVLSADDITRRFAYDRRAKTIKAHWVFIATCNDDAPLRDQTGARRFLPIKCHNRESNIVEGMTAEYIQQVWAETYYKFKQMFPTVDSFDAEKIRLTPAIQAQAADFAKGITQDDGMTNEVKGFLDRKILPHFIWILLTREERRKFFVEGHLRMTDAVTELIHRRKAIGGNKDTVQSDIDKISDWLEGTDGKNYVRTESIRGQIRGQDNITEFFVYGSEFREHICAAEIFNECFGADNRKRINRIGEILSKLEGWHLGARLQKADPQYADQTKPYYRK